MRISLAAVSIALVLSTSPVIAQGPMQVAPSGRGSSEVVITFVDSAARAAATPLKVKLDYGQPSLRGRQILTDSLVPYDKPWRTGANALTTLTTDVDLILGGKEFSKGSYAFYTLPSKAGWKLIVQKNPGPTPTGAPAPYDSANDIARLNLTAGTAAAPLETFTMWLVPSRDPGPPHGQLIMQWGTTIQSIDWLQKLRAKD
jgi:hypothetical protein